MHIGSSHVQAGTFPHQVRKRILQHFPNLISDRGMVFPYSAAAKCNNPTDYKVHCKEPVLLCRNVYKEPSVALGLCGIAVTAHDTLTTIQMVMNSASSEMSFGSNRIILFGESSTNVMPYLDIDNTQIYPKIMDLDKRRFIYDLPKTVDSFVVVLPCDSADTFALTGIYLANRKPGFSYTSIGVNGASLDDYLKCPYFTTDLETVKPDLVIFGIGINDATAPDFDTTVFHERYLRLTDSIRAVNKNCAFIFVTNNDSYSKTGRKGTAVNRNGLLAREVFYRLAEETEGAVWDQFEIMGGLKSIDKWYKNKLAQRDHVHFTRAGYELLGNMLAQSILSLMGETDK